MNRSSIKIVAAAFGLLVFVILVGAEQPQDVLGKINFPSLFDAAPAIPASTAEAGTRVYGKDIGVNADTVDLAPFYGPFNQRIEAARRVIQGAVNARPANQQAVAQRAVAEADSSAIIARMGGAEKMAQMSDQEREQAAMQAAANYQQSLAGGNQETSNATQAIMQRVMNEYRARFEKMTPEQQEAEMRNAMGPSAHVAQHTAEEEQRAMQGSNEMGARVARQNEISALLRRMLEIDAEFEKKDKAIASAPGNHNQIADDTKVKIAKLPIVHIDGSEMSYDGPDPAKLKVVLRERASLDRTRAAAELQQRTALFAERKAQYKELAASYANWLKQTPGRAGNASANIVNDSSADVALSCEEQLIKLAESLRQYHEATTRDAANYEQAYKRKMAEM